MMGKIIRNFENVVYQHREVSIDEWIDYYHYLLRLKKLAGGLVPRFRKLNSLLVKFFGHNKNGVKGKLKFTANKPTLRFKQIELRIQLAQALREAFEKSLNSSELLKSIWGREEIRPTHPVCSYFKASNNRRPRVRDFLEILWKRHFINDKGDQNLFSNLERIKILEWQVI